ncbi:MAG: M28 family metallopeptidase [Bacteroidota bacterium]|nr:M28 family metallopeptidase [Bacteroidota bacterium]
MKIFLLLCWLVSSLSLNAQTEFSQESAEKFLKVLAVDIGPRTMGSPAEQKALKFAVDKFKSFGCDTAYIMPMTYTATVNTNSGVAVGIKKGSTKRIIVIGGHIDSDKPETPGANDNGSGSAVVLEVARVLAKHDLQSTIVFALFGGEEQGLEGSKYFVDFFHEIDSVVVMLNVDMANGLGLIEIDPHTTRYNAPRWLVEAAVEEFKKLGYDNLTYSTHAQALNLPLNSDHKSFLDRGIPAIGFTTDINTPIHTPQDNINNFDPRGLKRSGDLVLKLVERFDSGVPQVQTERYWFYLLGTVPIFLPVWALYIFIGFSVLVGIISFIIVRNRRLIITQSPILDSITDKPLPTPRKWSGIKMLLFVIIPVGFAWFAIDIIGWIKSVRYPWFSNIIPYLFYSLLFGGVGFWISLQIEKKLRLSKCPYVFYKRSSVLLLIFIIALSFVSPRIAIYPAASLLLIALASAFRIQFLKIIFFVLSPLPLFRFIFNEWYPFIARLFATNVEIEIPGAALIFSVVMIIFFSLLTIPFFFAFGAVYRETPFLKIVIDKFRTVKVLVFTIITFGIVSIYLYTQPSYNEEWNKTVEVKQTFDLDERLFTTDLKSFEYLDSIKIKYSNKDTLLLGKNTSIDFDTTNLFPLDTTKYRILRKSKQTKSGDTTFFDNNLTVISKMQPYKVELDLYGGQNLISSLQTDYKFVTGGGSVPIKFFSLEGRETARIKFYSFPDVPLKIPFKFYIVGNDTIYEEIKITYSDLLYPMEFEREKTNFIKRTEIKQSWKYVH